MNDNPYKPPMTQSDVVGFDVIPTPQWRRANDVTGAIQLCGAFAFLVLALSIPQLMYLFFGLTAFCLFFVYEARSELRRIDRIVEFIKGKRNSRKQYAEGTHGDSSVQLFIGNSASVNYSVSVNGEQALRMAKKLRDIVSEEMR
ncbi:MAG: hypothetical protein ACI8W8_000250 [Rhodothermales bacterium]|jgi:hypothetical protein